MEANQVSGKLAIGLSLIALGTVVSGYFGPTQHDEGTAAHIFQLSITMLVPAVLVFLATMDWKSPLQSGRPLIFSSGLLFIAFVALYCMEHFRCETFFPLKRSTMFFGALKSS